MKMNIATRGKEGQMVPWPTEGPTDKGLARPALWVEQIEGKCLLIHWLVTNMYPIIRPIQLLHNLFNLISMMCSKMVKEK